MKLVRKGEQLMRNENFQNYFLELPWYKWSKSMSIFSDDVKSMFIFSEDVAVAVGVANGVEATISSVNLKEINTYM